MLGASGLAASLAAQAAPPCEPAIRVEPRQFAPAVLVTGVPARTGGWIDYHAPRTRTRFIAYDALDRVGETPCYGPACEEPARQSFDDSRVYQADDIQSLASPAMYGTDATALTLGWYFRCTGAKCHRLHRSPPELASTRPL